MNRTLVLAALLAAAPAFAQTSTLQAQSSGNTQAQIQKEQATTSAGTGSTLGTTSGSMSTTLGAKPVCSPSSLALTDCTSVPASGVTNPIVTQSANSLDATGTFSTTSAIVTPLVESVDTRNAGGLSPSGTSK